jgi:threonine/homoserine/homoserine lactone efflux protein
MRCFYHPTTDAVAACKSCGKGLCPDCATDLGKGVACRGRCEDDVRSIIQLVERNIRMSPMSADLIRRASSTRMNSAVFSLVLGAVMVGYSLLSERNLHFLTAAGGCFLVYGVVQLLSARRRADQQTNPRQLPE